MYVHDERVNQYTIMEDRMDPKDPFTSLMLIDFMAPELCTRVCEFCPRSLDYPNMNYHMSLPLVRKISEELGELKYKNRLLFCGFGESLLYKHLLESINILKTSMPWQTNIHMVTNGDRLTVKLVKDLIEAGLNRFYVSLYDGEHQVQHFEEMFSTAGLNDDQYFLQHYYLPAEQNFGFVHVSNRAGYLSDFRGVTNAPCNVPYYAMSINYDGKILLCSHDWNKTQVMGDLNDDSIYDVWIHSKNLNKYREFCSKDTRTVEPCKQCNIKGVLYGNKSKDIIDEYTQP